MDKKMKCTPGPWVIKGQDIIGNELNGYICTWSGRTANAQLISSAPDLLEALLLILPLAKGYVVEHNVGSNQKYIEIADQAIAKAEGGGR